MEKNDGWHPGIPARDAAAPLADMPLIERAVVSRRVAEPDAGEASSRNRAKSGIFKERLGSGSPSRFRSRPP